MTFHQARAIIHAIVHNHSRSAPTPGTSHYERERATATMLLALETRVKSLEAKSQGPDLLKPLGDRLGENID
jgi:hypothetical protein